MVPAIVVVVCSLCLCNADRNIVVELFRDYLPFTPLFIRTVAQYGRSMYAALVGNTTAVCFKVTLQINMVTF